MIDSNHKNTSVDSQHSCAETFKTMMGQRSIPGSLYAPDISVVRCRYRRGCYIRLLGDLFKYDSRVYSRCVIEKLIGIFIRRAKSDSAKLHGRYRLSIKLPEGTS